MSWNINEAIAWYKIQGAPRDQSALVSLLKEVQESSGGSIPTAALEPLAQGLGVKESYLAAVIRRFPSLRMDAERLLELCAGPNCGKHSALAATADKLRAAGITVRFVPCMRMCGKGPNIRWNGQIYHGATEELLEDLAGAGKNSEK